MSSDLASAGTGGTELARVMHYREQAAQFRGWAAAETTEESSSSSRSSHPNPSGFVMDARSLSSAHGLSASIAWPEGTKS